ncbi:NACHT domain-containing protein [Candidatus Rariloculus sp.]|uniref:NACHT domain-containing protein n=1 Tax=Candidatus Rariloculus sp. TaxID=3101265 RepID=UPI003D14C2D8
MNRVSSNFGGSAAAGGFGFQASIGAIAGIHTLRGIPVQWTDGLTGMAPCSVSFETDGPGDDLSLQLSDGSIVEIQVKKGLRADSRFWAVLDALCEGIHRNRCNYGILIVCPNSSTPVRQRYALALNRIGAGRMDGASPEQLRLASRLAENGYDTEAVCARIRIRTVSALEDAGDAIAAARAELRQVCADDRQVTPAWQALCQDALSAIASKSRRNVGSLSACLAASGVNIEHASRDSPVAISDELLRWTMSRTEHFVVIGISRLLPADRAWLPLTAVIRDASIEQAPSVEEALADYHALGHKSRADQHAIDAKTIGTFRKLCVVLGGPGSGKSLLLKVLARVFAKDSCVSLRVRLPDLATRVRKTGCGIEEGLMQLGMDASGVSQERLRAASLSDLVLLCDGLDECGEQQFDISAGLKDIAASHPSYRIVVTTRPIGYSTTELHDWRHYEIVPLAEEDTARHLETLCRCALDEDSGEETDELLPRIRAYLEEGGASRVLARSPLLLAFGAALFLNWKDASKTKLELYQRIFRLIDGASTGRQAGPEPPPRSIRNSVLNELGWLIAASPLRTAEELERQCAQTMEQALRKTPLQALTVVEASIGYWEEKGVIERLRHPSIDLIAFIHKTCGEFAAARHLSEMEPDEARHAIESVLANPDWEEILDFAAGTRLATVLAELLIAEFEAVEPDKSTLDLIFRVLARPEVSLSPAQRRSFVESVFALARSEDRQKAYRVGLCLTEHDLSRMAEVKQIAFALLQAPMEWSRLVGWAVLARHFPGTVERSVLEDALVHFMDRSEKKDFFVHRRSISPFGPVPERGVFENFILGALKSLLSDQDAEYQERLTAEVWNSQLSASVGFLSRLEALLTGLGRKDLSRPPFRRAESYGAIGFSIPDEFYAASEALLTEVVPTAFLRDYEGPPLRTELKCLGAFFRLAGIMEVPVRDVYVWLSDGTRLDAVHTLVCAAAQVFELDAERLAAEGRQAIATVESFRRDGTWCSSLDVLPNVDAAEADWSRGSEFEIDMGLVEGLVQHPSEWVQRLAAHFIAARFDGVALRTVCQRLLSEASGDALHWAAALTYELSDGCELLIHRLGGRDTSGLHHLFENLKNGGCRMTPSHLAVLEKRLLNRNARTAAAAARWCQQTASSADTWLADLLRSASGYWRENEAPYPTGSGTVPESPREALLRTLCVIAPPTFEELADLTGDPRTDVRAAAIDGLIGVAGDSSDEMSRLVESIVAKRFSSRQCEKLLGSDVPYRSEDLSTLCDLCSDQDSSYRLLGVRHVLTHRAIDPERALALASSMRSDTHANVRDAVHRFLDRLT